MKGLILLRRKFLLFFTTLMTVALVAVGFHNLTLHQPGIGYYELSLAAVLAVCLVIYINHRGDYWIPRLVVIVDVLLVAGLMTSQEINHLTSAVGLIVSFPIVVAFFLPRHRYFQWTLFFAAVVLVVRWVSTRDVAPTLTLSGILRLITIYGLAVIITRFYDSINRIYADRITEQNTKLRQYAEAVDNAADSIVITDPSGVVEYANPAVARLTGFDPTVVLGTKAGNLWGGLMPKEYYDTLWRTIQGKRTFRGQLRNKRQDGKHYDADITIAPILNDHGAITHFVGVERDITQEKQSERAKSLFVSLTSHQLRTPLTSLRWSLESALSGKLSKAQKLDLTYAYDATKRLIGLVVALLNVSRIEENRIRIAPMMMSMEELITTSIHDLQGVATQHKIAVVAKLRQASRQYLIDPVLIRQVVLNLLSNAIKYSSPGQEVRIAAVHDAKGVRVTVTDHGIGIPAKQQSHVFEHAFRAENAQRLIRDGSGLGLYLAKEIIRLSGGELGFTSVEGKGSEFWFTLPKEGMVAQQGDVTIEAAVDEE